MSVLTVRNLDKHFSAKEYFWTKPRVHKVLRDVTLRIEEGSCLGLVGESGCGKTTLGRLIAGIDRATSGEILIDGISVSSTNREERAHIKKNLQMVFQDSVGSANPRHTAGKVIIEPAESALRIEGAMADAMVDELMQSVGLGPEDKHKYSSQFSGGQIQRVCLARALSVRPKLIVLDEPISSLDVSVQAATLNLLADVKKEFNLAYLFISHDIEAVYYLSDALAVMYLGSIVEYIEDISEFKSLCHPYTKRLLSSVLVADPDRELVDGEYSEIAGTEGDSCGCLYAARCEDAKEVCHREVPAQRRLGDKHLVACHLV